MTISVDDRFSHSINYSIFFASVVSYIFSCLFPDALGFFIVFLQLAIWWIHFSAHYQQSPLPIKFSEGIYLFFVFTVYVLISFSFWQANFDPKNLIAEYLYLMVIPFLVISNLTYSKSFFIGLKTALFFSFWFSTFTILMLGVIYGIDFERSFLIPSLAIHKNALSVLYELQYVYVLYSFSRKKKTLITSLIILLGFACLVVVGSKTSLMLMALFTIGLLSRRLFIIGCITIGYALLHIMVFEIDLQSAFRTAYFRRILWEEAWKEITLSKSSLWLGNGPATFMYKVRKYGLFGVEGTHNIILQYLHNYGIIGLSIFSWFYISIYRRIGFWKSGASLVFWVFICHSLFDVGWTKGTGFFVSLFLGLAVYEQKNK